MGERVAVGVFLFGFPWRVSERESEKSFLVFFSEKSSALMSSRWGLGGNGKLHFLQECRRSEDAAHRGGKIDVCVVSGQRGNLLICRYSTYRHLKASGHAGGRCHTDVTAKLKQHSAERMECSRDRVKEKEDSLAVWRSCITAEWFKRPLIHVSSCSVPS